MPEPKKEEKTSKEEIKEVKTEQMNDEEKAVHSKATRSREDIEKIFIDNYGYTEGDPFLVKAVDREIAHGKSMAKAIGQKIHHREKYDRDIKSVKKTETETKEGEGETPTDEELQDMRGEASQAFVDFLGKDFPKLNVTDVYNKVKGSYKETGKETTKEDFLDTLKGTFKGAFPDEAEKLIRQDERKKVRKEDTTPDFSNLTSPQSTEKTKEKSFFDKDKPIQDWYPKKK